MAHKKSSIHKKCFRLTPITAAVMFGALNIGAQADVLIDGAGVIGVYGQEPDSLVSTPTVLSNSADDIHIQNTLNQGASRGSYGIRLDTASSQGGILTYSKVGGVITVDRSSVYSSLAGTMGTPSVSPPGSGTYSSTGASAGVYGLSTNGGLLRLNIENIDSINLNASNAIGIGAYATGSNTGDIEINFLGADSKIIAHGSKTDGINAQNDTPNGNITIRQEGSISLTHLIQHGVTTSSPMTGINAVTNNSAGGNVTVYASGSITVDTGGTDNIQGGSGILATANAGNVLVEFDNANGSIIVGGANDQGQTGIRVSANSAGYTAAVNIVRADTIHVYGDGTSLSAIASQAANGAHAQIRIGQVDLIQVTSNNASATSNFVIRGIATGSGGNVSIDSMARKIVAQGDNLLGIDAYSSTGAIDVRVGGQVLAEGANSIAIQTSSFSGANQVLLYSDADIKGGAGSGYGIYLNNLVQGGQTLTLSTGSQVSSANDFAVYAHNASGSTTVNNGGVITGFTRFASPQAIFNNQAGGTLSLQDFSSGSKGVVTSIFGTDGQFNNDGLIRFSAKNVDGTVTHAVFDGIDTFNHNASGSIDLSMGVNDLAGSTLTIGNSTGTTAYVSNGGSLILNTQLHDGGVSDRLILDHASTGSGATRIYIQPTAGSVGGGLSGDGIEVVTVNGTSSHDAFVLGAPVTAGAYEYILGQGSQVSTENNWYLQSSLVVVPPINPGDPDSPSIRIPIYNPNIGSYLGNQYAAATMFNHNILDRRDNVRSPDQTLWIRTNHTDGETKLLGGLQQADISTSLVQIGADLIKQGDIVAGIYGGYGTSRINNQSNQTGTTADGKVEGYSIGIYGSWMPEQNKGPYIDLWGHYAWYDNQLSGAAQSHTSKYDSSGYALSAEIGYGIEINRHEDGSAWILEPHAQVIYSHLEADNFYDSHGTWYSNNQASGYQTRLGARLYGQLATDQKGVAPFIELNWLHNNVDNGVQLNGMALSSDIGRNVGEVKIGVQGELTERLSTWGHIGLQHGSESFKRYEIQLGLGWQW
ncbi:AIDA-I autotransporter [Saezia sanguinis]|uniref:AIDA-I autotransporter n=3 Tax=Saezia sanguinis TaxID=1965230 RepID=A0A433SAZ2_9BURK|nr:AIDA-I autotransporter [Saezia sanguinis]